MRTNHARWVPAALCVFTLLGWDALPAAAQYSQPDGPHRDGHPHDGHVADRLAEVLERLDRIADRLEGPQGEQRHVAVFVPQHTAHQSSGPWQPTPSAAAPQPVPPPTPSVPTGPQPPMRPEPPPVPPVGPMPGPGPQFQPPAVTRHMMPMQPGQLPPPLVEMLEGRDRQLAEMREMFEARASEMAEAHERQMAEMREAIEARVNEMAAVREQSEAMMAEMGKQVAETREQVAKTLQGMGAFKQQIEEARHAMGMFKEHAEKGGRRFDEMADRLNMLEREIDRLHAELRERDDDRDEDEDEEDDEEGDD